MATQDQTALVPGPDGGSPAAVLQSPRQPAGKPWAGRGRGRRHIFEKMLRAQRLFRAEVVPQWWPQERGVPSRLAPTPAQGAEPDLFWQKVKTVPPLPDATEPAARRPLTPRGSYLSGPPLLDTQRELAA